MLRFDSRERVFPSAVDGRRHRAAPGLPPRVYGHVARERGRTWLQYWIFYASNPQDRGIARTGRHEGDWELVQVRLAPAGGPDLVTLAQHSWAEGCGWAGVRRRGAAPVVFVANGSHASYARPGSHGRFVIDPDDEADGRGRTLRPPVERIRDRDPAWVSWPGRWGDSRAGFWPGEQSSPRGPRFQADGRWSRPATFHETRAVDCGAGAPWRPWHSALVAAVAVCLAAVALLVARRLRARRY